MMENIRFNLLTGICFFIVIIVNITLPGYVNGFSLDVGINIMELWDNRVADFYVQDRSSDPVFSKRPAILSIQIFCKNYFDIPYQAAFNIVNLFSLIVSCYLIRKISAHFGASVQEAYYGVLYYLTSFPIVFAFTGYTSSYDDFIQHLFLLLSIFLLTRNNFFFSAVSFLFALIVRETSLIFLPFFLIFCTKDKIFRNATTLLIVILIWACIISNVGNNQEAMHFLTKNRFLAWQDNFASPSKAVEVIICIILVNALPLYMLYHYKDLYGSFKKYLNWLSLIIIVNIIVVVTTSLVHETRLLFLPLLAFAPIVFKLFEEGDLNKNFELLKNSHPIKIIGYIFLVILIVSLAYSPSIGRSGVVYKTSAGVYLLAFSLLLRHKHFKLLF